MKYFKACALFGLTLATKQTFALDNVMGTPCASHAGAPRYYEASGICTGNLMTQIPLTTAGIVLTHNSLESTYNHCVAPGWRLSTDETLALTSTTALHTRGDGARFEFDGASGASEFLAVDPLITRNKVTTGSTPYLRSLNGASTKFGTLINGLSYASEMSDSYGVKATITRNAAGCPTDIASQYGKHVTFTYSAGRLTGVTDMLGATYTINYNPSGLASVYLPDQTSWQVTTNNGLIAAIKKPDGLPSTQYKYFANSGVLTTILNSENWQTSYIYSPTSVVVKSGGKNVTEKFSSGRYMGIDTARGKITYVRDSYGRIRSIQDIMGRTTTYDYASSPVGTRASALPNVIQEQDGTVVNLTYDSTTLNILQKVVKRGAKEVTSIYTWDNLSQLTSETTNDKTITYERDSHGNLKSTTDSTGQVVSSATFDSNGNLASRTDRLGRKTTFTWVNGRLSQIKDNLGRATNVTYNDTARTATYTNASGLVKIVTIDILGRPISNETKYVLNGVTHSFKEAQSRTLYSFDAPKSVTNTKAYDSNIILSETRNFAQDGAYTFRSSRTLSTADSGLTPITVESITSNIYGPTRYSSEFPAVIQ